MPLRPASFLVLLTALAACSLEVDAPASPIPGATTVNVAIGDFLYQPDTVMIGRGSTVVWTNTGPSPHTTTSDSLIWDSKAIAVAGPGSVGRYGRQFPSAGTFAYHCDLHPTDMAGTVIVTP
jgi:plastocyanin